MPPFFIYKKNVILIASNSVYMGTVAKLTFDEKIMKPL